MGNKDNSDCEESFLIMLGKQYFATLIFCYILE